MTRTTRGYIARRRRKKFRSFALSYRGVSSQCIRTVIQQKTGAWASADRDRDKKKGNFRRLWITRINAVIRENIIFSSYSRFIKNLYKRQLLLNRKIISQMAILNRACMDMISNAIITANKEIGRNPIGMFSPGK